MSNLQDIRRAAVVLAEYANETSKSKVTWEPDDFAYDAENVVDAMVILPVVFEYGTPRQVLEDDVVETMSLGGFNFSPWHLPGAVGAVFDELAADMQLVEEAE